MASPSDYIKKLMHCIDDDTFKNVEERRVIGYVFHSIIKEGTRLERYEAWSNRCENKKECISEGDATRKQCMKAWLDEFPMMNVNEHIAPMVNKFVSILKRDNYESYFEFVQTDSDFFSLDGMAKVLSVIDNPSKCVEQFEQYVIDTSPPEDSGKIREAMKSMKAQVRMMETLNQLNELVGKMGPGDSSEEK
jgi:hypothetical protein